MLSVALLANLLDLRDSLAGQNRRLLTLGAIHACMMMDIQRIALLMYLLPHGRAPKEAVTRVLCNPGYLVLGTKNTDCCREVVHGVGSCDPEEQVGLQIFKAIW